MATVAVDRAKTQDALVAMAGRVAGLVRGMEDTGLPIPGWDWTAGEMLSHLVITGRYFADLVGGATPVYAEGTRQALAAANAHHLKVFTERNGARLADQLEEVTRSVLAAAATCPQGRLMATPMGDMDVDAVLSYALAHTIIHGYPMAKALGRPFPLDADQVVLTLPFITTAMFQVVVPERVQGLTASFLVHLRGAHRLAVVFDDGALSVEPVPPGTAPARPIDCHISADPVAFFLVAMRLASQWGAIARGKLTTWGRKPWLALRFVGYFEAP